MSYAVPASLPLNQWTLGGKWIVGAESALSAASHDKIVFRFHARDLHLVLGPGPDGKPVRFRVTIEGREPGADHGADTDAHGNGSVAEQRLYQLIRQSRGHPGPHLQHRVPRSGRARVFLYLRLIRGDSPHG